MTSLRQVTHAIQLLKKSNRGCRMNTSFEPSGCSSNQMQFIAVDSKSIKASLGYHGLFEIQIYLRHDNLFSSKPVMQLEKPRDHEVGVPDPFLSHIPQSTELISEAGPPRHSGPTAAIRSIDMSSEWKCSQSQSDCHPAALPGIIYIYIDFVKAYIRAHVLWCTICIYQMNFYDLWAFVWHI